MDYQFLFELVVTFAVWKQSVEAVQSATEDGNLKQSQNKLLSGQESLRNTFVSAPDLVVSSVVMGTTAARHQLQAVEGI
jgi:hypothetical protein